MRIIIGLFLWPLFIASAVIRATKLAFTLNRYTRCKGCRQTTLKESAIFGYCSVECAIENSDIVEDVTDEVNEYSKSDWLTLQNDEYTHRSFDVFLDQNGFIYLQDFADIDNIILKVVGHDGTSL
jgi:hypothetical protein